jgi:hypothetical protein
MIKADIGKETGPSFCFVLAMLPSRVSTEQQFDSVLRLEFDR